MTGKNAGRMRLFSPAARPAAASLRSIRSRSLHAAVLLGVALLIASAAVAEDIRVITNIETRDVYVGESFLMQITVDGAGEAEQPDFSGVEGFMVEFLGGSNNSSQSISIINGRVQRTVKKGFVFTFRLTPKEVGRHLIPALDVNVQGTVFKTDPVTISVKKPEETEDFKLRIELSRESCYAGEPVILSVVWYLNRDVESFNFTAPVLDNDAFDFEIPEVKIDPSKKYFRIPIGSTEVIAEKGQGMLGGERYVTLSFDLALIPRRGGVFDIPEFIVACESGTGVRNRRDFFDDFFSDNYRGNWRGSLKKYVVPSNALTLSVKDLPIEGRPPGFAGYVGELKISASAEPTSVNVGDPITLSITVEGPDYLGRLDLPPLSSQEGLVEDFKIPEERADGRIEGRKKIFTQTLRARHDKVRRIPSIKIAYFDTSREEYLFASSDPIDLDVRETKVVTASDAEGMVQGPSGSPLEKWKEGIAYNYEGEEVLVGQEAGIDSIRAQSGLLVLIVLPPVLFILITVIRSLLIKRSSDPDVVRARGALKRLQKRLSRSIQMKDLSTGAYNQEMMEALKEYLGDKLGRSGAALTAGEADRLLSEAGAEEKVRKMIGDVFGLCEQGAYAGGEGADRSREKTAGSILDAARRLEKQL